MARRDPVGSLITRRPTTGRPATRSGKIKAPPGVPAGLISLAVERGEVLLPSKH
jgi:hypothetical protein